jgi:hypothetical protein
MRRFGREIDNLEIIFLAASHVGVRIAPVEVPLRFDRRGARAMPAGVRH